ncbi:family 16 glycoside hydrolase [Chryseobacterium sp. MYb264]|uniref:family 16 glycoside hydrolase n=1 Tax=Chryseobacterium sp. MYb264 TaxID=2745153 RepID=UPI002E0EFB80|nr:family 16 glycoside hydrolase [Chryseobacterium sp. MYb264]
MLKRILILLAVSFSIANLSSQTIRFDNQEFETVNVNASIVNFNGEKVLKAERDLDKVPFDINRLEETVDEPTFLKLKNVNLKNGIIEMKVLAQIQNPSPFEASRGFIGIAYRINEDNSQFKSIYLRPKNGRSDNQIQRNHSIQYFSYPNFKFEKLRDPKYSGQYETYADMGLNEWITMKIEVKDQRATLYLNDQKYPSFIVDRMLGTLKNGSIGLRVDIGTIGYFKDIKITKY